jgi:hypothetical protein
VMASAVAEPHLNGCALIAVAAPAIIRSGRDPNQAAFIYELSENLAVGAPRGVRA